MPKVSQLPDATFPLNGTEYLILNQDSPTLLGGSTIATKKALVSQLISSASVTFNGARTLTELGDIPEMTSGHVVYTGVAYDTGGFWSDTAPTVFRIPRAGYYHVGGWVNYDGTDTSTIRSRYGYIATPYGTIADCQFPSLPEGYGVGLSISADWYFAASDTVTITWGTYGDATSIIAAMWIHEIAGVPAPPPVPPVPPVPPAPTLYDQMIDADGTLLEAHAMDVGPGWTILGGVWTIQNNQAVDSTPSGGQDLAVSDCGAGDATVIVQGVLGAGYDCAAVFNAVDGANFWMANLYGGGNSVRVWQVVAGVFTLVDNPTLILTPLTPFDLVVITAGDRVTVSVNAVVVSDTTTASRPLAAATLTGLRSTLGDGSTFGPFTVYT